MASIIASEHQAPKQESDFDSLAKCFILTCLGTVCVRKGGRLSSTKGPVITFWPSLLMSGRMWSAQVSHYIQQDYCVVVIDPPGHGESDLLKKPFTFQECAQCIQEVLDALSIVQTHFVGNSWGGMIGATFAARYPHRIGVSVLMNCTASSASIRHQVEYRLLIRLGILLGRLDIWPLRGMVTNSFVGPTTLRERPQVVEYIHRALSIVDVISARWAVQSVVIHRPDQHLLLAGINTPVLIIAGQEDGIFSNAETQAMATCIPGADFILMAYTAHLTGLEVPNEVNFAIDSMLSKHK